MCAGCIVPRMAVRASMAAAPGRAGGHGVRHEALLLHGRGRLPRRHERLHHRGPRERRARAGGGERRAHRAAASSRSTTAGTARSVRRHGRARPQPRAHHPGVAPVPRPRLGRGRRRPRHRRAHLGGAEPGRADRVPAARGAAQHRLRHRARLAADVPLRRDDPRRRRHRRSLSEPPGAGRPRARAGRARATASRIGAPFPDRALPEPAAPWSLGLQPQPSWRGPRARRAPRRARRADHETAEDITLAVHEIASNSLLPRRWPGDPARVARAAARWSAR